MKRLILIIIALTASVGAALSQERLTLEDAIAVGLKKNYGVILSRLDSDIASENRGWGAAGALPTITASGAYNISKQLIEPVGALNSNLSASVDGSLTLFDGYDIRVTKQVNDYLYQLSKGSEVIELENVIYDITLAYYNYLLSLELLNINKEILDMSEDRYLRDKDGADIGGKRAYDMVQSESAYLTDKQNYINQEKIVRQSLYTLNLVMGVEINSRWVIEDNIAIPVNEYALGSLLDRTFKDNSTLKNQYINQKVLESNITLEKDFVPRVDAVFGGEYNYNPKSSSSSFQPYAGVSLKANIFAGGMIKRNVHIAKIKADMGEVAIEEMKKEITSDIMSLLDEYNYCKKLYEVTDRALEVAKINLTLSEDKLSEGTISSFDYRIVQMEYLEQAYNKLKISFDIIEANTALLRISGGMIQ